MIVGTPCIYVEYLLKLWKFAACKLSEDYWLSMMQKLQKWTAAKLLNNWMKLTNYLVLWRLLFPHLFLYPYYFSIFEVLNLCNYFSFTFMWWVTRHRLFQKIRTSPRDPADESNFIARGPSGEAKWRPTKNLGQATHTGNEGPAVINNKEAPVKINIYRKWHCEV